MNLTKTKLAKAVALAVAGAALSAGAISTASADGITMYNTFSTASGGDLGHNSSTDGWTRTYDGTDADTIATGPESQGNKGDIVPWVGTAGGALPFNYTGSSSLNWAAELQSGGGALQISRADAVAKYGTSAEIDTGAGAWQDNSAAPTGWKHQTDIGIIKSDFDGTVTLHLSRIDTPTSGIVNDNFGVTIFTGIDTHTTNYSHHGSWNCPTCATPKPFTASDPFGTTGLAYLTHDGTVDGINGVSFHVSAGQYYTIYLGGAGVGTWSQNVSDYAMDISAVPEPASLSLFGIAYAAMAATRRRKPGQAA